MGVGGASGTARGQRGRHSDEQMEDGRRGHRQWMSIQMGLWRHSKDFAFPVEGDKKPE